jgi:ABC-type transport system involved in cytochrome bd biosynthesis fused ATPase/permease subunit
VLDDALTGLDRETEKIILENVFAARGIIKGSGQTVIMATNSGVYVLYSRGGGGGGGFEIFIF